MEFLAESTPFALTLVNLPPDWFDPTEWPALSRPGEGEVLGVGLA
jgi:hypothetical protein